jgi:hypothetical protein
MLSCREFSRPYEERSRDDLNRTSLGKYIVRHEIPVGTFSVDHHLQQLPAGLGFVDNHLLAVGRRPAYLIENRDSDNILRVRR